MVVWWCLVNVDRLLPLYQTKLALNSSAPPSKYSALNKMVDVMVLVIIGIKIVFCIIAAILAAQWVMGGNPSYLVDTTRCVSVCVGVLCSCCVCVVLIFATAARRLWA